jgi:hypothetical protein
MQKRPCGKARKKMEAVGNWLAGGIAHDFNNRCWSVWSATCSQRGLLDGRRLASPLLPNPSPAGCCVMTQLRWRFQWR